MQLPASLQAALLDAARQEIRRRLAGSDNQDANERLEETVREFAQPAGCFVSLHEIETHRLRGCVGRLEATQPLSDAVRDAACSVLTDPRFVANPVTHEELPSLEIEVTVLSPLVEASGPLDFDLLNEGTYLHIGDRAGCFLPQVARETGWTREQLLDRLCVEKLQLPSSAWQQPGIKLQKFTALIIGPEPFEQGGNERPAC